MEVLYSSLVKSSLEREDVASMEKENLKNSYEIRQALRNATNAYDSYKWRTSVELVVAIMILFFYAGFSNITGLNDPLFNCNVHGILFKCVIPNSRFYYVSAIMGCLYLDNCKLHCNFRSCTIWDCYYWSDTFSSLPTTFFGSSIPKLPSWIGSYRDVGDKKTLKNI